MLDKLVVGVAINPGKGPIFDIDERVELVREEVSHLDNTNGGMIEVIPFQSLLIRFAQQVDATVIVRGLRAVSDFEYEFQLASMNRNLCEDIETMFLTPDDQYGFLSSTLVREVARLGGDVSQFVGAEIALALKEQFGFADS